MATAVADVLLAATTGFVLAIEGFFGVEIGTVDAFIATDFAAGFAAALTGLLGEAFVVVLAARAMGGALTGGLVTGVFLTGSEAVGFVLTTDLGEGRVAGLAEVFAKRLTLVVSATGASSDST